MLSGLISFYSPAYPLAVIYMLQRTEYRVGPYLRWHWKTDDFRKVMYRGSLDKTKKALALLILMQIGMAAQLLVSLYIIWLGTFGGHSGLWILGISLFISYPLVWAYLITIPLLVARYILVIPREKALIASSRRIFEDHPATKIAVAGSYGKTTMKELLAVVLAAGKKVAVTPANKNTPVSHAHFADKLKGDEEILVIEYGEGKPKDVKQFALTTHPNIGIITGLAPAHLDHYPTLRDAGRDIFSLATYLQDKNIYVNGESEALKNFIKPEHIVYSSTGTGEWKVSNVKVNYTGISFNLTYNEKKLNLSSGLLGRHQIGPLSVAAILALKLGMTNKQVEDAIGMTVPFEHRMEPRELGGAWLIDDTYNGNIDGIKAGLALLKELPAKRKVYVTPGLVDQGIENIAVHEKIGEMIAEAAPDQVVLMRNSVTNVIQTGLIKGGFNKELRIEEDPLNFYSNVEQFVAAGDLIMMQNDWPDNYY